jgi:hypothetical protein
MAAEWIPCGGGFIAADVMRWNEGVWQRLRRRRGRLVNIGDPVITAEVLRDEGGWLDLLPRLRCRRRKTRSEGFSSGPLLVGEVRSE